MTRTILARTLLLLVSLTLCANCLWAQGQERGMRGVPGYLDPLTGEFRTMLPALHQQADDSAAAPTTFGGTFSFTFTITVSSTIGSTVKIGCEGQAVVADSNGTYIESAAVAVVRGTGGTVSCTVKIPYSWALSNASTDQVQLTYSIISPVAASATAGFPNRSSVHTLPPIAVPANGATTSIPVTATI